MAVETNATRRLSHSGNQSICMELSIIDPAEKKRGNFYSTPSARTRTWLSRTSTYPPVTVKLSVLPALGHFLETAHGVSHVDVLTLEAGERFGDGEGLRKESLDLTGACHRGLVVVGKLVDAQDRDDILQILVALQDLLDRLRRVV